MGAPGRFVWFDLMSTDPATSIEYYKKLFGWTTVEWDMGDFGKYTGFRNGETAFGGVVALNSEDGIPSHWIPYVTVDDVDAACERATGHGGIVCVPGTDIPEVGRFAVVTDPQGAVISPYKHAGTEEPPEPDGPAAPGTVCWSELLTNDVEGAKAFYGELFGWGNKSMDMGPAGTYTIFTRGEEPIDVGGLMQMPPEAGARPHWLNYVSVESVEEMTTEIANLGGTLHVENQDIPGVGAFSVASDPTGAPFAIWKPLTPP